MSYGEFINSGKTYTIMTSKTPTPWKNVLINDDYYTEVSQRLCGPGFAVEQYKRSPVLAAEKHFYLKINGNVYHLAHGEGKEYSCKHYLHKTVCREVFQGIQCDITVIVPTVGKQELWQIELKNRTSTNMDVEIFSCFEFANIEYLSLECEFDEVRNCFCKSSFPYHITYDEYEKLQPTERKCYVICDVPVSSYECSKRRYWGGDNPYSLPVMVEKGCGSNLKCEYEDCVAAFGHKVRVYGLNSEQITFVAGETITVEQIEAINDNFPDFREEHNKVKRLWDKRTDTLLVDTGHEDLNYFINYWLKKQSVFLTRHNRGGVYCPVRNQLQDAMGYAVIDPKEALEFALKVLRRQHENGYLKQWYMTDSSPDKGLCLINHSDACVWLIICMIEIIELTGDKGNYALIEKYMNSEKEDTVLEHLKKAAFYMASQVGVHGLCLMKDGDWTDPINGAGRKGKGESTWNTLALIYAIKKLCDVAYDQKLNNIRTKLTVAVNTYCWDEDRYIAGYDDEGIPFGCRTEEEGSLFINVQTWALIAGVCDEGRIQVVKKTIDTLKTDFGYRLLYPAFNQWNHRWGKISIKQKGNTENGSVYSHGNMFKAFADFLTGDREAAINTMRKILPTNPKNDSEINLQLPMFIPNYYVGNDGADFGRSSNVYGSGAVGWMLWLAKKYFVNLKQEITE